ncbi:MAG: PhoU domain-containing protein [Candidatus Thorarchaeota archaeon]
MRTQLEFYIDEIRRRLERLYELSSHSFMTAIKAFEELDQKMAASVQEMTAEIDELALKIEDNVFETIARRQPVAKDLRTLASYNFVALHLYRIGRHAHKVAHITKMCEGMEHYKELQSIPYLARIFKSTLDIAMNALLNNDFSEIDKLEKLEAESDRETVEMFEEIADYMKRMSDIVRMSLFYVLVGRYCERAADHAFSIAERAIYVHTGHHRRLGLAYRDAPGTGIH